MVKCYLKIAIKYSAKKECNYPACAIYFGNKPYFINLSYEAISAFLNMTVRDVMELTPDFEPKTFEIHLGE